MFCTKRIWSKKDNKQSILFFCHSETSLFISYLKTPVTFERERLFVEFALIKDLMSSDILFEELECGIFLIETSIKGKIPNLIFSLGSYLSSWH